jgi:cation:H+ antiporter
MCLLGTPGIIMRTNGLHTEPLLDSAIFGLSILAAAFVLSWAAEAAELDISQGLALAVIALIAVLPEYAVDAILAWEAGADPAIPNDGIVQEAEKGLAIANMTGGNRLLIGIAWPLVFVLFFYRTRIKELVVDPQRALELVFLAAATLYVIFIPLRDHVTLLDTIVLVSMFLLYVFLISRQESEEVELVGPSQAIGGLPKVQRRAVMVVLLLYSAVVIFASAEPFAHGLVETGQEFGISEFFLIQWLAPLASESPEVLVACLLAWRGRAAAGMGALISSKVNQWTLLIGTLPLAYSLSAGDFGLVEGLPLDTRQREEIFLTAAQSAFAIAVFINLKMGRWEALALFVLFATQLFITDETARVYYAVAYTVLCVGLLIANRYSIRPTFQMAYDLVRGRTIEHEDPPDDQVHSREPAAGP